MVAGKLAHYTLLYLIPLFLHGPSATLSGAIAYMFTHVSGADG